MASPAYQWEHWRFEPSECRLLRDGVVVSLPAKTLDLLSTLLRRAPRLVTKEEILAAVWAGAVVEEGNIAFHVNALRKVLDEADGPSAIETVRGRGYRFVHDVAIHQLPATDEIIRAKVVVENHAPSPPAPVPVPLAPAGKRRLLIALLAVVIAGAIGAATWLRSQAPPWSIAVQPFEILDPPDGQENFPAGLRTYLNTKLTLAGIATADRETATAILSGQLHPRDGGFGVTIQLTRVSDGARVWNWSFDVPRDTDLPPSGQDDARSRLQGALATRAAEGIRSYLSANSK